MKLHLITVLLVAYPLAAAAQPPGITETASTVGSDKFGLGLGIGLTTSDAVPGLSPIEGRLDYGLLDSLDIGLRVFAFDLGTGPSRSLTIGSILRAKLQVLGGGDALVSVALAPAFGASIESGAAEVHRPHAPSPTFDDYLAETRLKGYRLELPLLLGLRLGRTELTVGAFWIRERYSEQFVDASLRSDIKDYAGHPFLEPADTLDPLDRWTYGAAITLSVPVSRTGVLVPSVSGARQHFSPSSPTRGQEASDDTAFRLEFGLGLRFLL